MADGLFRWREIADGVFQITNVLDERAYLVRGDERLDYGSVMKIVKMLYDCKIHRMALVTVEK